MTEAGLPKDRLVSDIEAAVEGGVDLVQLRLPNRSAGDLYDIARALTPRLAGRAHLIVNDRVDVALAVAGRGVQLGESGLPVAVARQLLGPAGWIGRSVHSVDGARSAEASGADFLVLGTIFETGSHPGVAGAGIDLIRRTVAAVKIPVIAIGGISVQNAADVRRAGAAGIAVISAIFGAADPVAAARDLRRELTG